MKIFDLDNLKKDDERLPIRVLIVSDNKSKIENSVAAIIRFFYLGFFGVKGYTFDFLDNITEELMKDKEIKIKKGDSLLVVDLLTGTFPNKEERRNMVFVDTDFLPIDEIERKELIKDLFDPITKIGGLNSPIKNIPKTFII